MILEWYGYILKMNDVQTPKKILNVKIKEKHPRFLTIFKTCTTGFKRCHTEGRKRMGGN
jgi:hypothetical protein